MLRGDVVEKYGISPCIRIGEYTFSDYISCTFQKITEV
jgi:hypothetical protein